MSTETKENADTGFNTNMVLEDTVITLSQLDWGRGSKNELLTGFRGNLNTRDHDMNYDFENNADDIALLNNIAAIGVTNAPIVARTKKKAKDGIPFFVTGIQGTRRLMALTYLSETDPERFAEICPNGVRVRILPDDASEEDLMLLVADHATIKKLTPIEQYYTIARFHFFGWSVERIASQTGIKKGLVTQMIRIAKLSEYDEASTIYLQCIKALRGKSGDDQYKGVKMPASSLLSGVESVCRKDEQDKDEDKVDIANRKSELKASEGLTIGDMTEQALAGVEPGLKARSAKDIAARLEVETEQAVIEALSWVLQIEGYDWSAEEVEPSY